MSTLIDDEHLFEDMYRTLKVLRMALMPVAEQHVDMDLSVIDGLTRRYEEETGRKWTPEEPTR